MARFLVHGLVVETASSLGWDPGAELLAGFPVAPDVARRADLRLEVKAGAVPEPPDKAEVVLAQGELRAALAPEEIRVEAPGFLARVDLTGDRIEATVGPGSLSPHALVHVDLFVALAASLRLRGWVHLHAACTVAADGAPLLIVGQGGSGKSTLCTALVAAGHRYLGDDVVFLEAATGRLLAFPRPFHLGPAAAAALPEFAGRLGERYGAGPKRLLDAAAIFPDRAVASVGPPRALLFSRIDEGAASSCLEPLAPVEAVAALLESSAFVAARLPGHREQLAALVAAAESDAAFRVLLGHDLLLDPAATARALANAALAGGEVGPTPSLLRWQT